MSPIEKWRTFISSKKMVRLYCADPGAFSYFTIIENISRSCGNFSGMYASGWALSLKPHLNCLDQLFDVLTPCDTLFVGSQVDVSITRNVIRRARDIGAEVVFVFDHWKNFNLHFDADSEPDVVVLPDVQALQKFNAAVAHQFSGKCMILSHLGVYDFSLKLSSREFDVFDQVAIFLDPVYLEHGLGYDWRSALVYMDRHRLVFGATKAIIKPHPRQSANEVSDFVKTIRFFDSNYEIYDGEVTDLVACSSEVWGMTSIVLISSALSGKKVRSFQPKRTMAGRLQSCYILDNLIV